MTDRVGVELPQKAYTYRVNIKDVTGLTEADSVYVRQNVHYCDSSYLANTIELEIRQPITHDLHRCINTICESQWFTLVVEHLSSHFRPTHLVEYTGCEVTSHSYRVDYAIDGPAVHKLALKFKTMTPYYSNREGTADE